MFWTIVAALLFVFVVLPIVFRILAVLGIVSFAAILDWFNNKPRKIQETPIQHNAKKRPTWVWWVIGSVGGILLLLILVSIQEQQEQPTIADYSALNASQNQSYNNTQSNFNAIEQQKLQTKYNEIASKVALDNPDKTISSQYETYIRNNLSVELNYLTLKEILLERGFTFIGFESSLNVAKNEKAEKIESIVDGLEEKYLDKSINFNEEQDIRRNLPSNIFFNEVKDVMLERGFEFVLN